MAKWKYIASALVILLSTAQSLKILGLFPHPGASHFHFFHPIMRALAEAGHEVTVVSHFPDKSPLTNYKDIPLTGIDTLNNSVDLKVFENRRFYNHFLEFFMLYEWGKQACEYTLKSAALTKILKSHKRYDVILLEQFNTDCMMGVAYELKAPVIALSSCAMMPWHYARFGAPLIPSYVPALFLGYSEQMNFMQRLANWITIHAMNIMYKKYTDKTTNELLRKRFGNDMPDVADLAKETSLMFVNQHFSLSGAKPLPRSIIELGGVHIQKAKTLDVDLQSLLDGAEHGVIYISWGSMIRAETLPIEKREAILKASRRLKQTVLWKWENETLPNQPPNVHIRKWMPQREILCHPNVIVFLTHGGLMGSSEAAYCGVPVVSTPMYGDQFLNSAAFEHRGMGVTLHYEDITETAVLKAVKTVLEPKVQDKAKRVAQSFKSRPKKALETAVWWVEYVAKTEGAALTRSASIDMSPFVYYLLDVYTFFIAVLLVAIVSWILLIRRFWPKKIASKHEKKPETILKKDK